MKLDSPVTAEKVLITGGAGFIGSRLARRFVREGYAVVVLDALIPQVHGEDPAVTSEGLALLGDDVELIVGSITDGDAIRRALDGVSIVVHLAAETGTGQSMYEIDRYVSTNTGGTALLLDILTNSEHTVQRVVVASSRSVYGEGAYQTSESRLVYPSHRSEDRMRAGDFDVYFPGEGKVEVVPTGEDALLHPSSVYGITKQMQESLVMTVAPSIGIDAVALRYQNVYGPGQSLSNPYTGILSIFSTLIRQNKEIRIFEDGFESRDFVFIDDIVEATFLASVSDKAPGNVLNVGSGVATTVHEVVAALLRSFGTQVQVKVTGEYRLGDIRHNVADISRLREILDYAPQVGFDEGVSRFVSWVRDEPLGVDNFERSLSELAERGMLRSGDGA